MVVFFVKHELFCNFVLNHSVLNEHFSPIKENEQYDVPQNTYLSK